MTFTFRPAKRENVPLIILLAGGTGSGKTFTAMELATGLAGGKRFAVLDTEAGRAKHYADRFEFDHGDLQPPFRPAAYQAGIDAADKAGYPVIVVDSGSHEHAGEGGLLDWHEEELIRMAKGDWKKREACKMAAWIAPKAEHKRFVSKLLQLRAHLIICLRAEEKIEMVRDDNGKMVAKPKVTKTGRDGWVPICEKNLPYEATCSFLLLADRPGVGIPIKLQEQHRHLFPVDKPITRETGKALAEWARGGAPRTAPTQSPELALVLTRIAEARTEDELKATTDDAKRLSAEERDTAKAAYLKRGNELRTAPKAPPLQTDFGPPPMNPDEIPDEMKDSTP